VTVDSVSRLELIDEEITSMCGSTHKTMAVGVRLQSMTRQKYKAQCRFTPAEFEIDSGGWALGKAVSHLNKSGERRGNVGNSIAGLQ
jgi:hypothetical protein